MDSATSMDVVAVSAIRVLLAMENVIPIVQSGRRATSPFVATVWPAIPTSCRMLVLACNFSKIPSSLTLPTCRRRLIPRTDGEVPAAITLRPRQAFLTAAATASNRFCAINNLGIDCTLHLLADTVHLMGSSECIQAPIFIDLKDDPGTKTGTRCHRR
ncbi:unnamed protein product (mitochondrion) [Plasmodiophora brassicae]|uniref:Uncharacterized protein n=1 Tax=Plasmodiophora brassicae TaxID=37360 RepID=A0A3P3YDR8_PLABS|nr:unnamed protein product [Plasmodiophora brassicae]